MSIQIVEEYHNAAVSHLVSEDMTWNQFLTAVNTSFSTFWWFANHPRLIYFGKKRISLHETKPWDYVGKTLSYTVTDLGEEAQIFLKSLTGKTHTFKAGYLKQQDNQYRWKDTVESLKLKIWRLLGIPPSEQRLVYAGLQLEDDRALGHYGVCREATIHLTLRLRGNGDMVKNHVIKISPLKGDGLEKLDTVITVQFDDLVYSVDVANLFDVRHKNIRLTGFVVYDKDTRVATFSPRNLLPPDSIICVVIRSEAITNQVGTMVVGYRWEFKTECIQPVTIRVLYGSQTSQLVLHSFGFTDMTKLLEQIDKLVGSGTNIQLYMDEDVQILDDSDIYQLRTDDEICVKRNRSVWKETTQCIRE